MGTQRAEPRDSDGPFKDALQLAQAGSRREFAQYLSLADQQPHSEHAAGRWYGKGARLLAQVRVNLLNDEVRPRIVPDRTKS